MFAIFFTSFNTAQTNCKIQSLFLWFWFPRFKYLHQIGDEKTVVVLSKELVFFRIDILRLQSNLFYSKNKILQKSYNCRISLNSVFCTMFTPRRKWRKNSELFYLILRNRASQKVGQKKPEFVSKIKFLYFVIKIHQTD